MRITFVLDTFGGGGKERRCLQLLQGLNEAGYTNIQVIIVNNDIAYQDLYDLDIELIVIDRKNKKLSFFQTYSLINSLIKKFNPNIVQVWGTLSAFYVNFISCFNDFKLLGSYVADCNKPKFFSLNKIIITLNILLSDYIIGNSLAGLKAYNIPVNKAKVIYNGFNQKRYENRSLSKDDLKNKLNITALHVVSMIARVDYHKDQKTFIEAAKTIIKSRNDVDFLIVGKGDNLESLRKTITQIESEHIHFLGFRSDVEEIIKISNITVLCTNPLLHKEGVSNSILESLAFGVPVIATNDGGTPEIVENGINGFLINAFDSMKVKNRIIEILDNDSLNKTLSKNAIKIVKEKFTLHAMTNNYIKLYKQIC